ncbi:MAG: ABC transporter substrate-binding protein [Deltaproteobacteria bacterium]|jgi:peptide/nickel transport system substrate-binding protein|nr:ABC transporter substrate-binding protein [Deltaproteobacteria bacterium]
MRHKPVLVILLIFLAAIIHAASGLFAAGPDELIIAKPFGPSVKFPDPAKGNNGWYTNEAGVTETLFALDYDMNPKPWLAESFINVGPLVWEIRLRKGILFHDNTPLNASAVKRSIDRICDEKSEVFNKRIQQLLDLKKIRVKDDYTLVFETGKPNAAFIYDLTSPGTGIIVPDDKKERICGTGPFVLEKVILKKEMIVRGFDEYWGGKPGLERVYIKSVANPMTRMLAFEAGQVDIVTNFSENDAERVASTKGMGIIHKPTNRLCFFFVRVADGPLADPSVRQALNFAINRQEIVDAVLAGVGGEVGASIFPGVLPWNNPGLQPYPYDPDKALKLLAEAGAKDTDGDGILEIDGRPLALNVWTYETRASLKLTIELLQVQLGKVGIATKLKVTRKGTPINQAMRKGEVHLNLQMWNVAPQGDPDYFISNVFTQNGGSNYMGYHNPDLDALVSKGKTTFDHEERKKIYDRIQKIIYDESPVIVLFHKSTVSAVYDYVENYRIHPAERYILSPELRRKQMPVR